MNAIFTIVAKNYLPLARTLGDSIFKLHPEIPFYIVIADEVKDDIDLNFEKYPIIQAVDLEVPGLKDLAFKYNVTEYCTALKPYAYDYLFEKFGFEKIIYFDPDIFVFNKLDTIFNALDSDFIVLTPHFLTPELHYTGTVPEGGILFLGMFNLGFVAINNSVNGRFIVQWWKNRLVDKSFADKVDGYHTDQKWMDFIPVFFENGVCILRKFGYNMAFWNIHERTIVEGENGNYVVHSRLDGQVKDDLVFFHFAGFDPYNLEYVHKFHPAFPLFDFPDLIPLMQFYKDAILSNGFDKLIKIPYSYAAFDNGELINHFQRRLYRSLSENGFSFENPFAVGEHSFHDLLRKNKLLAKKGSNLDKVNVRTYKGVKQKQVLLNRLMKIVKSLLGFEKYALLLKFASRYVRPENQTFLINEIENKIGFIDEKFYTSNSHRKGQSLNLKR